MPRYIYLEQCRRARLLPMGIYKPFKGVPLWIYCMMCVNIIQDHIYSLHYKDWKDFGHPQRKWGQLYQFPIEFLEFPQVLYLYKSFIFIMLFNLMGNLIAILIILEIVDQRGLLSLCILIMPQLYAKLKVTFSQPQRGITLFEYYCQ